MFKSLLEVAGPATFPLKTSLDWSKEFQYGDLLMCMSILSEHWAPKCSGTCCLSIMLTLLSTKLWNDGELWLLKKLILYLWIQCQDSFIFQAATNGLDYNSPGSRVYHQGLWSESTSCRIWTNTGCFLNFHFQNDQVLTNFLALGPFNEGPVSKTPFMQIPFKY